MKLIHPTNPFSISQKFGTNANTYYAESGYKGHTGIDVNANYGQVVISACDGYVYSLLNKDNSDLMKYRAVFVLYDDGINCYEISYGHAKDILATKGQTVKAGVPIITAGNTGDVATGGKKVTREEKEAGSTAGTHLHFQIRPVVKVKTLLPSDWRLSNDEGALFLGGYYFKITEKDNGYVGCVDPEQFMKHVFYKTLKLGIKDVEVAELQKVLGLKADGIFGPKTLAIVKTFQTNHGLKADGIVGTKTNEVLNKL